MWSNTLFSCKSHSRRRSSEFLFLSLCIWLLSTEKADFFAEREIKNFFGGVSDQNISYVSYQCDNSAFPILDLLFETIRQEIPCRT